MNTKRPVTLTIAIILLALLSLGNLALPLFPGVPPLVTYGAIVLGMILAIIVSMLNALSAASGIAEAPNMLKVLSTLNVVLSIVLIVLVVLPSARSAYAAGHGRVVY